MNKDYLLGFDVGTYESKGTICNLQGSIKATASAKHTLKVPKPGYAEHDPINDWWHDFKCIVTELLEKSGVQAQEIAAVGISTIMAAVTPVDKDGNPLRNAILYGIDTRCINQVEKLNTEIGKERITAISGRCCTVESYGAKILWIKENEPEIFAKTKHFTFASGFLTSRLTGRYCVDRYSAMSAQPMLNIHTMDWNDEMCSYVLPKEMLPEIVWTTDVIGNVTADAARETGLFEGTPVIAGTTDAGAEAVSVGVVDPGEMMMMYGSTAFFIQMTDSFEAHPDVFGGYSVLKGRYDVTGGMATTGSLTCWIKENFAKELVEKEACGELNAYDTLFAEADNIPPGSEGVIVLPYFMGERMPIMDPKAKGVIFGLNLHHTRGHIVNAVFEGIGYGIAQNLDMMAKQGYRAKLVTAVGGGTKTPRLLQIVSDITGVEQRVPKVVVGASYGDALLAGIGIGVISSPSQIKEMIEISYITKPNPERHLLYKTWARYYAELYTRTKDIMHNVDRM